MLLTESNVRLDARELIEFSLLLDVPEVVDLRDDHEVHERRRVPNNKLRAFLKMLLKLSHFLDVGRDRLIPLLLHVSRNLLSCLALEREKRSDYLSKAASEVGAVPVQPLVDLTARPQILRVVRFAGVEVLRKEAQHGGRLTEHLTIPRHERDLCGLVERFDLLGLVLTFKHFDDSLLVRSVDGEAEGLEGSGRLRPREPVNF